MPVSFVFALLILLQIVIDREEYEEHEKYFFLPPWKYTRFTRDETLCKMLTPLQIKHNSLLAFSL